MIFHTPAVAISAEPALIYSLTTVASEQGLQADMDQYNINADVCNFFTC